MSGKITQKWPQVSGSYTVGNPEKQVLVITLGSHLDEGQIAPHVALVGPCKTENIGLEKIIANTVSNTNIRYLLMCGAEVHGHLVAGSTKTLFANGIDDEGKIIDAPGAIPFLSNISPEIANIFRDQVELVDLLGIENIDEILRAVENCEPKDPYEGEPITIDFSGGKGGTRDESGLVALTPDVVSIESRIRALDSEVKDLGKLSKFMSGVYSGLIQGIVLGFILVMLIYLIKGV